MRGFVVGAVVLGVAGIIELTVTWGVAHALGVREIGAALEPVHAAAPTGAEPASAYYGRTPAGRGC